MHEIKVFYIYYLTKNIIHEYQLFVWIRVVFILVFVVKLARWMLMDQLGLIDYCLILNLLVI